MIAITPRPASVTPRAGTFVISPSTTIGGHPDVAEYLAAILRTETGMPLPLVEHGDIQLALTGDAAEPEQYTLVAATEGIRLESPSAAGLFAAVQSLRQLVDGLEVACVHIDDSPRFAYRGAMLDVARHFFGVADVKRYIDDIAMLKLNYLHLHLTDDQGWRLQIDSWPLLTEVGGQTQVGGGGGGYYSKAEYREIVAHAASRFVTIVPEIDMPGHTNAALHAYPELTPDGVAVAAYEGIEVGFSSLDIGSERTYEFVADVLREVAELTPGPYLHLGGDESLATSDADFLAFIARATAIAAEHGKTIIGWHEMGRSHELPAGTVAQYWSFLEPQPGAAEHLGSFVEQGGAVIMSPADVSYLDMKYDAEQPLGLVWANGPTTLEHSYRWEPTAIVPGIGDQQILGIEAPVWTETATTIEDVEFLAFPRLAAIAEIAWSPPGEFSEFATRLPAFGERLDAAGIRYYRAPGVAWR